MCLGTLTRDNAKQWQMVDKYNYIASAISPVTIQTRMQKVQQIYHVKDAFKPKQGKISYVYHEKPQ